MPRRRIPLPDEERRYAKPANQPRQQQAGSGDAAFDELIKRLKAGAAGSGQGRRKPYTAKELADARKQQEQLLKERLSGPFTQEAILSRYAGQVASILGASHPKAEQLARYGMDQKLDDTTFAQWLRARPEYLETENYQTQRANYLSVLAETFGYR